MTKERAAQELLPMYYFYKKTYGDPEETSNAAVVMAIDALAESAGRDICAECGERRNQLNLIIEEVNAIRAAMGSRQY